MADDSDDGVVPQRPVPPDIPAYLVDGLDARSPDELDAVATYAEQLAAFKCADASQRNAARERKTEQYKQRLREMGEPTSPNAYEGVPDHAYINIKAGGTAYYWQWRTGSGEDADWDYKYITAVEDDADGGDGGA